MSSYLIILIKTFERMRTLLYYGFILPDGTELCMNDEIRTHEQLAIDYINKNYYSKEYRKLSYTDPTDFLVIELGAIKVGNFAKMSSITVAVPYYSDNVKHLAEEYGRKGYRIDRIFR